MTCFKERGTHVVIGKYFKFSLVNMHKGIEGIQTFWTAPEVCRTHTADVITRQPTCHMDRNVHSITPGFLVIDQNLYNY